LALDIHGICPLLAVFDMPTSIRFYCEILGFEIVNTSDATPAEPHFYWLLLRLNGAELMLNTAYAHAKRPPTPDQIRIAHHRDTILYFDCPDVDSAYQYLLSAGIELKPPFDQSYGMRQLYFTDPDGYQLCFHHPVRATAN
jgi:catechol 2,3-dioxygenase-like lactoylglutathione lyase family enzyme